VNDDAKSVSAQDGIGLPPLQTFLQGYALNEVKRVGIEGFSPSDRSNAEALTEVNAGGVEECLTATEAIARTEGGVLVSNLEISPEAHEEVERVVGLRQSASVLNMAIGEY
jgi:hypothetical protein